MKNFFSNAQTFCVIWSPKNQFCGFSFDHHSRLWTDKGAPCFLNHHCRPQSTAILKFDTCPKMRKFAEFHFKKTKVIFCLY